ncbi:uncharacterized protein LOC127711472 [Mytilus californianus]|uniref:uncharacterized protein LOC127711472 n=1 Tax=Mytilus californianus TaxID=6549 RepID=UPI0022484F17|nr:uncharacterized protein LOC127711472 [Mytilus californianus]
MLFTLFAIVSSLVIFNKVHADCGGKADIIFAIPGNNEIPGEEFFPFERFLTMLVDYFKIDRDNVNIGLILYGREPVAISWPQPMKDQTQTNTRVSLLAERELYNGKLKGRADVKGALNLMRQMFRNPSGYHHLQLSRPDTKQIGVMFTHGSVQTNISQDVITAANQFKEAGIEMYSVGNMPNGEWYSEIASHKCKILSVESYSEGLKGLLPYIGSSICTAIENVVNVTDDNCFPKFWKPSPNPPVTCPSLNAIFQDPYNCAYLFKCDMNIPVRERCPTGMLFDNSIKACNHKDAVPCYSMITCPNHTGLFPHPEACNKFLNCFDNIPYVQKCPSNLYFNNETKICDEEYKVNCTFH